jgi:hypothetical protein
MLESAFRQHTLNEVKASRQHARLAPFRGAAAQLPLAGKWLDLWNRWDRLSRIFTPSVTGDVRGTVFECNDLQRLASQARFNVDITAQGAHDAAAIDHERLLLRELEHFHLLPSRSRRNRLHCGHFSRRPSLIRNNQPIAEPHDSAGAFSDSRLVRDWDNCETMLRIELLNKPDDFLACPRVERSSGFVGEQY